MKKALLFSLCLLGLSSSPIQAQDVKMFEIALGVGSNTSYSTLAPNLMLSLDGSFNIFRNFSVQAGGRVNYTQNEMLYYPVDVSDTMEFKTLSNGAIYKDHQWVNVYHFMLNYRFFSIYRFSLNTGLGYNMVKVQKSYENSGQLNATAVDRLKLITAEKGGQAVCGKLALDWNFNLNTTLRLSIYNYDLLGMIYSDKAPPVYVDKVYTFSERIVKMEPNPDKTFKFAPVHYSFDIVIKFLNKK